MKKIVMFALFLTIVLAVRAQKVTFYSPEFEFGVKLHLGLDEGDDVQQSQMDAITEIDLSGLGITDIRDVVYLPNVEVLNLSYNYIDDVSALLPLESLRELDLSYNRLKSINILAFVEMDKMMVDISNNQIEDLSFFYAPIQCQFVFIGSELQAYNNFLFGDVNSNKKVEVADFIATANYILGNPPQEFYFKASDLNNNKNIEVSDFIGIANIILNSSVSSNAPAAAPRKGPRKAATDVSTLADAIYVEPVTAAPGTQQVLSIQMKNSNPVAGFEFRLQLPDGITVATDEDNILMAELSTARTTARKTDYFGSAIQSDGTLKVLCGTSTADPKTGRTYTFSGNEGEVALITINIPDGYVEGVYEVGILDARFSDDYANLTEVNQTVTSELTIGDNSIVLDENDTTVPSATTGNVNIVVKRTIVANRWNTICLPFNMTEAQVYAAFGNDVQLQEFDSYDASYDDSDNVTGILVHFLDTDMSEGIYANYPYLIKTSHDISQFTVNSTIDPDEEGAVAEYDNGKSGRQRKVWGSFIGTYHAQTTVPENGLFLNENKFWYSDGTTKMKAFRAYFMFDDVLSSMDSASAKISMVLDGETTGVHALDREQFSDGAVYTIQGQLVGRDIDMKRLPSGVYIVNGKKIVKQ